MPKTTAKSLEQNAKSIKKLMEEMISVRDDNRPAGAFTTKEFAAHVGISSKTALKRLDEFASGGLLESLGRQPATSPLTGERTAIQMYRFITKK